MSASRASHTRQRAILAAGLISTGALTWAAFAPWGDARARAQLTLESRLEASSELVRIGWQQLMESETVPAETLGQPLVWTTAGMPSGAQPQVVERHSNTRGLEVFDVLLARAEDAARQDLPTARAELALALEEHPEAAARPEALLRAIQFSVQAGDTAATGDYLDAASDLSLLDARKGTSYVLLAALAAAPELDERRRIEAHARLVAAWAEGSLALPRRTTDWRPVRVPAPHWVLEPDPWHAVLGERLGALGPGPAVALTRPQDTTLSLMALERIAGPLIPASVEGRWELQALGDALLLTRRDGERNRAHFVSAPALARALDDGVELAVNFRLLAATEEIDAVPGQFISDEFDLAPGILPVRLFHPDPTSLVRAEQRRITALRLAFGALALLTALATGLNLRALARERRLAELKSSFIAGASHDLRTPLASILLMAENLEEGRIEEPKARARYYSAIRREAGRLRRLVDDVLDFSRMERGEGTRLAREEVQLEPFLDELDQEVRERVERAGGSLETVHGTLPEAAYFDPEAVRRCVWNLVDNALAHSGSDQVRFSVHEENDQALVLEVADRGRGVAAARREDVFAPFRQGPDSNTSAGGTGLGLAIVREVARAHGGDAVVVSGPDGIGAVFQVRLDVRAVVS